ncbi:hypothetical protein GF373_07365 [bacterium]|nr:hypothetical protein [bacterium]
MAISLHTTNAFAAVAAMSQDEFIKKVKTEEGDAQLTAWQNAPAQPAATIGKLGALIDGSNSPTQKCAEECIHQIVHSAGKRTEGKKRDAITRELIQLIDPSNMAKTRQAFRCLSLIADGEYVPQLAKYLEEEVLFEEAVFCIERIPGEASAKALMGALDKVPDKHKERLIAALGHRRDASAVGKLSYLMMSSNHDIALKATEAISKIGIQPAEGTEPPKFNELEGRQKAKLADCYLRFCDHMIKKNQNLGFARDTLMGMLGAEEGKIPEHFVCAAMVSLSKWDDPEAVRAIGMKLGYEPSYIVRQTAKNLLLGMKGDSVDSTIQMGIEHLEGDKKKALQEILKARKG